MLYTDILKIDWRFKSSINLQYDIGNLDKIECYIPTDQSVQVLKEYLSSIYYGDKNGFATVLIGPYGKGKSHLMLVLLTLLASTQLFTEQAQKDECIAVLNRLIDRIEKVDVECAQLAKGILEHKKPLLPVIVDSNATEINQVLILALRNALEKCGYGELLPEMNFDVALQMIDRWKQNYPEAYQKLAEGLLPHKYTVEDLRDSLGAYSRTAYDLFVSIYPEVTSGSIFAPIFFEDAIQLYKSVNHALMTQTEFGGMFIVYDEFSKFLEANLDKSKMLNFKVIQELAELSARSSEPELHFACITHKDLLSYNNSDSFRTVVGRFRQIEYVHSSEQAYELIANALEKEPGYDDFLNQHHDTLEAVRQQLYASGIFRSLSAKMVDEVILRGCFPLAPMTAFGLLRISEKVAQNERTLFTFLASREQHSVMSYIQSEHDGMTFITLDTLFDYFAPSFAMEVINREIHSVWAKASAALRIAETDLQQKFIKALAVILIIGDDQARANAVSIKTGLLISDEQFMEAADRLCALQVLTKRDISGEYAFLTANGVDIKNSLQNYINSKLPKITVCEVLDQFIDPGYVLPRQYNNERKIIRFFRRIFMDLALFSAFDHGDDIIKSTGADGAIIQIVAFSEEERKAIMAHYHEMDNTDCILIAINSEDFPLEPKLKELVAIQALKQTEIAKTDAHYAEELEIYEEDALRYLQKQVAWDYSTTNENCKYYHGGKWIVSITRGIFLSKYVTNICEQVYSQTPVINNEMINKTVITGPIKKARALIVDKLLQTEEEQEVVWEGYGPEVSIYRSTIENKGINGLKCAGDPHLEEVLEAIDAFARKGLGKKARISELYSLLTSAPFGVRKGIIPIYLAYVLRRFEGVITFYWGEREFLVASEVIENVDAEPEKYELFIDESTEAKEKYIANLCGLFGIDKSLSNRNSLIVLAMQRWIRGLPKVVRDAKKEFAFIDGELRTEEIPKEYIRLRKSLLAFDVNVRELLMERIPQDILEGGDYTEAFNKIVAFYRFFEGYIGQLKSDLVAYAKDMFVPEYEGSLSQAISIWRNARTEQALKRLYDIRINQLLKVILSLDTNDDEVVISQIGLALMNFAIEDWNDAGIEEFGQRLKHSLIEITEADATVDDELGESVSVTISKNRETIERMVASREISLLGKTLMNNLRYSFDEYGGAIPTDEKAAILIEMLKEVLGET